MPYQKNSSIVNKQKPVNIFYVWYSELCRRLNSSPAPVVKPAKPKCQTVLDFVADRLKVEEWSPVINALRHDTSLHVIAIKSRIGNCQFLHEVDTEEKLRQMKRRSGSLWTDFILKSLLKSLSCTIRNTQVLTCLEFDGLPLFTQYLEPLLKALQKNKTLKMLSLSRCRINDAGCQMVCAYVRFTPNIEVLNMSACGLTAESGEHLAKLIKYQQINRYCESWHNSLRYSDPNIHIMRGLKRITLNGNPLFGDEGLDFILNELDDDLWIKALDMQKCGITENMSMRILDVVQYSQSLEIVDFRLNDQLSIGTIEQILTLLKQKHLNHQSEFQWCNTTFTLTCESVMDCMSTYTSVKSQVHKVKSAPLRKLCSKMTINDNKAIRRTKTSDNVPADKKCDLDNIEKKVFELNSLLQEEITRRKETEKVNEELLRKLEEFRIGNNIQVQIKPKNNIQSLINAIENIGPKKNGVTLPVETNCSNDVVQKNGFKNGTQPYRNGASNGYNKFAGLNGDAACTIFEQLINKDNVEDKGSDEESLLDYIEDQGKPKTDGGDVMNGFDVSDSQISLFKFMENLKNTTSRPVKFKNRQNTSKY